MFPVKQNDVWDLYKISIDCILQAEDIDLSRDYVDWMKLTSDEKYLKKWYLLYIKDSDIEC